MPRFHEDPQILNEKAVEILKGLTAKEKITPKDRMEIPVQKPAVLDPLQRSKWQDEVEKTFTPAQAVVESNRCLQCKVPNCVKGCPVNINIPGFMAAAAKGEFAEAVAVIKQSSLLPAICGRVCPQERQCQENCTMGKKHDPVSIGKVERFLADWDRTHNSAPMEVAPETGHKVAVIGSGPAGLVVAADCRRAGHEVHVFEALHKLGGVLRYGIPEFRLPKAVVDSQIDALRKMGVHFHTDYLVGRTRKLEDMMKEDGFEAAFIGVGAGLPIFMGIPGEDLIGVCSANEYLTRANLMGCIYPGINDTPMYRSKKVVVLGGGNVAMDSCRMAKRLGAEEVTVLYRRGRSEMPARREEVQHAFEEGIRFCFLQNACAVNGDDKGRVKSVTVQRYELGEPDQSGRRSPVKIEGDTYELECDTIIVAIGNRSNPLLTGATPALEVNKKGNIIVNEETGETSMPGVFAGGDIVLGAATVILAMGEGRRAARGINEMLAKK